MDNVLYKYYYDPKLGYQSADKLQKKLKSQGYDFKLPHIKEWITKQDVHQQFKVVQRPKTFFPIVSPHDEPFELLQIDLLDISNLSASNNGVKYLLLCIDVHTRYVYAIPMKNKFSGTINEAIEPILKDTKCKYIECDNGKEFQNKTFKDLLKTFNAEIIYVDVGNHKSLGIVDRFCKTIRGLINKYLSSNNTTKYINVLPDLIYNYNNSFHKGINGIPALYDQDKIKFINIKKQQAAKIKETKFEVSNNVRYVINRKGFEKGTLPHWSSTIHKIIEANPHSYVLDNNKTYMYYELQPAESVQKLQVISTRSRANIPSSEQLKKAITGKRRLNKESIDQNEVTGKRQRTATDIFHF